MTFQPPPPPPGGQPDQPYGAPPPAGPPPGGQWGTPSAGGGYGAPKPGFDPKSVNPLDWGIIAAGVLALIFSFVSFYTASVSAFGTKVTAHESAWHGFFGWFGALLALVGSVLVAMSIFAPQIKLSISNRLAGLGAYAIALICVILAAFITPGVSDVPSEVHLDTGRGIGFWITLIVIVIGAGLSLVRLQQTGGQLPGPLSKMPNVGAKFGGGGSSPQLPPPAAQGYAPPPAPGYAQQPPTPPAYQPPPPGYGQQPPPPPAGPGYGQQPPPPPGYTPPPQ